MFRNILLPLDFTEKGRVAVERAAELVDPDGGIIQLLHVIETIDHLSSEETREFYQLLEDKAEKSLEEWAMRLDLRDVGVQRRISFGKRAPEIVRFARESDTDLVIVASHCIDSEQELSRIGTISHQVALMAHCPVLLLR